MKTLIAIDGSDCSEKAVEFVTRACTWKKSDEFLVLSVIGPLPREFTFLRVNDSDINDYRKQIKQMHTSVVEKAAEAIKEMVPEANVTPRVTSGNVASTIVDTAEDWRATLIVIGSHGRKGFRRMLLGSVAEEVLRKASCTVEVVKESTDLS